VNQTLRDMHLAFLNEIRREKAELAQRLASLDEVERYHAGEVRTAIDGGLPDNSDKSSLVVEQPMFSGENTEDPDFAVALLGKTKHDACEAVLRRIGDPSKIREIMQVMRGNGYGIDLDDRILHNSLYTAMNRKPETFVKHQGSKWGLVEWEKQQEAEPPDS